MPTNHIFTLGTLKLDQILTILYLIVKEKEREVISQDI